MHSRREYYEYSCKRLKLAQVLGQLGVFLTTPRAVASPHAVTSTSKISATPHAGLRRPHTQSRPGQGSVQHPEPWTAASQHAINAGSKIEVQHPMQDYGVPARSHGRVKAQCNTPCRALASPHAVTAGSRLSATPRIRDRTSVHVSRVRTNVSGYCTKFIIRIRVRSGHACMTVMRVRTLT